MKKSLASSMMRRITRLSLPVTLHLRTSFPLPMTMVSPLPLTMKVTGNGASSITMSLLQFQPSPDVTLTPMVAWLCLELEILYLSLWSSILKMVQFINLSPCKRSVPHLLISQSSTPSLPSITIFPAITRGAITMLALL